MPGAEPIGMNVENIPMYRTLDLGYDPVLDRRMNANEMGPHGPGAPMQRGVHAPVRAGAHAELRRLEPITRSAYIAVPLHYPDGFDSRLHPHALEGWVDYDDLAPHPNQTTPFRKVRTTVENLLEWEQSAEWRLST